MGENPKFFKRSGDGKLFPFTPGLVGKPGFVPFNPDTAEEREAAVMAKLGEFGFLSEDGEIDQDKVTNAKLAVEALKELDGLYHELKFVHDKKEREAKATEE